MMLPEPVVVDWWGHHDCAFAMMVGTRSVIF